MSLSRESKVVCGVLLILTTTIMFGGYTLLGILTKDAAGHLPSGLTLDATQYSLWRAGHAHAGVYVILSLILQPLVDHASLSRSMKWVARLGAPFASIILPAGFFGVAFLSQFKWLIYAGMICLALSMLLAGWGLLKTAVNSNTD